MRRVNGKWFDRGGVEETPKDSRKHLDECSKDCDKNIWNWTYFWDKGGKRGGPGFQSSRQIKLYLPGRKLGYSVKILIMV